MNQEDNVLKKINPLYKAENEFLRVQGGGNA